MKLTRLEMPCKIMILMPFIHTPHHFITKRGEEILTFEVDQIDSEIGFANVKLRADRQLGTAGIQHHIKIIATASHGKL